MMTERALVEANNFDLPGLLKRSAYIDDRIHGDIANPERRCFPSGLPTMDMFLEFAHCRPVYRCRHLCVLSPVGAAVFWFR